MHSVQKFVRAFVSVAMVASIFVMPSSRPVQAYDQAGAQTYLMNHASNPWSTMGLAALGAPSIPGDYLKNVSGTSAVDFEAPILAITALDHDPRDFGPEDLVAKLKSYHSGGQLGDAASLNDDIFGVLALVSAGEPLGDATIGDSKNFLLTHQNSDGGWGFTTSSSSDTNMTATAILALRAAGVAASDSHLQNALSYLEGAQNDDGGFPYDPHSSFGTASDTSSTAWVAWGVKAMGTDPASLTKGSNTPLTFIESNQKPSGFFEYQNGFGEDAFSPTTTAYAVIALGGKFLPLHTITVSGGGQGGGGAPTGFAFRIEGSTETVCRGNVAAVTALDIVKNAKDQCGYTYHIKDTSFGPYLDKINNDEAAGLIGWLYLVNNTSPSVGAADYTLQPGDSVTWFYGDFNWKPLRLTSSASSINSGASDTVTVESLDGGNWSPAANATVFYGASQTTTDNSGHASLSPADGFYQIFAEKSGFIRSNAAALTVGDGGGTIVGVKANIIAGHVQGDTIAFTVNPSQLDFGSVHAGASSQKTLTINNTGTVTISVAANFSGDSVFHDNLNLGSGKWDAFHASVNAGAATSPNATLTVPSNYSGATGDKTGQLTFWATGE